MTHFSSGGDKYLGGENLLELLAFEAYTQNFQTLKEKTLSSLSPTMTGSMSNALDLFVWTKPTTREGVKKTKGI